ncbi:(2,3-dihydroxybenzoyl)adenylate synthase [Tsukamurella soli]
MVLDGVVPYPDEFAERYREKGYWTGQTHSDLLFASAADHADEVAVIAGDRRITYARLAADVSLLAGGFDALGIRRGDRVVVHLPNVPEFVEVVFALFDIGAIPVLALASHRRSEIEYFIEHTGARAYVTIDRHDGFDGAATAAELRETQPTLEHTVIVSSHGGGTDLARLMAGPALPRARRSLPEDVAFLQLSGGTTGRPKLIPRTHDDYLYSVRESDALCGVTDRTVQLVGLPISHNFTMSSPGILGVLAAGGTLVLAANGTPDVAFPLIEEHRVTQAALVPSLALAWLNSALRSRYDLGSLETILVGGAKFSAAAARRVGPELGCGLQQVFGMAEGLVNYTRRGDDEDTIVATQGRPISPDDEVRVVDDDDRDLPDGEEGHLLVRGPYTIRGYYRAPDHNARSFTADGFYRTGDVVRRDARGYLTVVGRSKDQINRGGEKISPEEIENLILGHDAIHDVSVVGVPDESLGERTKAYVIRRDESDGQPSVLGLRRFLRDRGLAPYKIPDLIEFVTEFPLTGVGKTSKRDQRVKGR